MLLCEGCGYVVDGLGDDGACPECGKPIGESLPRERSGSAYQRRRGWGPLIRTWGATLARPRRVLAELRIDEKSGMSLMWRGLTLAIGLPILFYIAGGGVMIFHRLGVGDIGSFVTLVFFSGLGWLGVLVVGVVYTTLAVPRLKLIARGRGVRMDNALAWTIAGQASMGLTIWPLCFSAWGLVAVPVMIYVELTGDYMVYSAGWYRIVQVVFSVILFVGLAVSFVEFEVLLSMGTRRLRFRNRVEKAPGQAREGGGL